MSTWPASLPQTPLASGFSQSLANNVVRTEMDTGKAKVRRRFSAGVTPVQAALSLTGTQKDTLIAFYSSTLSDGADEFSWTDHLNGGTVSYRFVSPPQYSYESADLWRTTLNLEIVP